MDQYPQCTFEEDDNMPYKLPGIIVDNFITINKNRSLYEKHFILAEEIGHYLTTAGDITKLNSVPKVKAEVVARRWGYEKIISLDDLVSCFEKNHLTAEDVAHDFEIELDALKIILDHYFDKYGPSVKHKGYIINFDPFIAINLKTLEGGEYL
ncbi:ImmA/IrrE family metallo-endopeptidase [Jeotgalibacillus haloalkalitolerans]|uniref:ImmA/IrrE family metallo-endopeptidase n=1 Tax=Jeotgalibacillus haloalkalitolerans TaxID=3104292 RepID=A0ABU5KM22_9BACL|nr:ImmA/IrrE family metallo-endopeptidase [Jeotgalibacillus sp. HH7-29]MDZ5712279.1 ImmA/IrrE family metallo-endopeptidase [Jeotgalibacillus sp. HH7-29]